MAHTKTYKDAMIVKVSAPSSVNVINQPQPTQVLVRDDTLKVYVFKGVLAGSYTSGVAVGISTSLDGAIQAILLEYDKDVKLQEEAWKNREEMRLKYGLSPSATGNDWIAKIGEENWDKMRDTFKTNNALNCWPTGYSFDDEGKVLMRELERSRDPVVRKTILRKLIEYEMRRVSPIITPVKAGFALYCGGGD
jgi:hypothetical protein